MRFVSIQNAQPGMHLANDLYDSQGRTVIGGGCELTANYIKRLKDLDLLQYTLTMIFQMILRLIQ